MGVNLNDWIHHALVEALEQLCGPIDTLMNIFLVFISVIHL